MSEKLFTFADLFAGIGGFHLGLSEIGGECVFACENDKIARKVYENNFKNISPKLFENDYFFGDIKKIDPKDIPYADVYCAGFPCQAFSKAGLQKGFLDERGSLFFEIIRLAKEKKPKVIFLENVRELVNIDEGGVLEEMERAFVEMGYSFYYQVMKASDFGLPQIRARVYFICFRDDHILGNFRFPSPQKKMKYTMSDIFGGVCDREIGYTLRVGGRGANIEDKRNWENYIVNGKPRRIGVKEAMLMQGFPLSYSFENISRTRALQQLGNSVAVDAVSSIGKNILKYLDVLNQIDNMNRD